jgi:predicted ATP-dependent serine protease
MGQTVYKGAKWQCESCDYINPIQAGVCKQCKEPQAIFAAAVRLPNLLSPAERAFYEYQVPEIIMTLKSILYYLKGDK